MGPALDLTARGPDAGPDCSPASRSGKRPARIGLLPRGARTTRARLLDALERAYPVRFEEPAGRDGDLDLEDLDGLLVIGPQRPAELPAQLPSLQALGGERPCAGTPAAVALGEHSSLTRALRGTALTDGWVDPLPAHAHATAQAALATVGGAPAWVLAADDLQAPRELVSAAPAELAPGESLRERLAPERCLALLALVHFVRRVAGDLAPQAPLDAAFVLDDPNLHWPRYGHVRYAELARHACAHGYHMVIAMPPIDARVTHPRAVRIFREHPAELSLCIHGNDHLGPELGRIRSLPDGLALAGQALTRAAKLQRRTGLPLERVMVPPHEQLSEPAARALLAAGFDAVCVSRPYPWIAPERPGAAAALSAGPPARGALAGWDSHELVAGGLPVLLRTGFDAPREDLVLRAFLGQPLILYGHHDLLADGLDVLADATAAIDALGDVRWGSLAKIAHRAASRRAHADRVRSNAHRAAPQTSPSRRTPRTRLRPLLRRLTSEARDRACL
jgi:hypothetical protein